MIVVTLTNCPDALRGDLTLWLQEISVGVFVGNVNSRVRENLWNRIVTNIKNGYATMSYTTNNEQRYTFRVHNTPQDVINHEGLTLVLWPAKTEDTLLKHLKPGFSNAAKQQQARKFKSGSGKKVKDTDYVVVDIETTGLNANKDRIIQIAALHISEGSCLKELNCYIAIDFNLSKKIVDLTGISDQKLVEEGQEEEAVLIEFKEFIGNRKLVGHNIDFDLEFISKALERHELSQLRNKSIDTLVLSKRRRLRVSNYKLSTLAEHFEYDMESPHTAINDCLMTQFIYEKLIESEG